MNRTKRTDEVVVHEIFKAVYVWMYTSREPELLFDKLNNFVSYRWNKPTEQIFQALDDYGKDKDKHHSYVALFKKLRNQTYYLKKGDRS